MLPSSSDAYNALQDYSKNRKSSTAIQDEANNKYDISGVTGRVSQLRALTNNLSNSIDAVDPSVTGRTSGSLVTEAQRSALVNRERQPLVSSYTKTSGDLGNAQGDLNSAQGLASQFATGLRQDDQTAYDRLQNNFTAAQAAEAAAEAKRQWEAQQAEQRRQFDIQAAESAAARKASAGGAGGYSLGGGGQAAPSLSDTAYQSVQKFLAQGKNAAVSDYNATLDSANRGNAMDKLKIQFYNKAGINPVSLNGGNLQGLSSYSKIPGLSF